MESSASDRQASGTKQWTVATGHKGIIHGDHTVLLHG